MLRKSNFVNKIVSIAWFLKPNLFFSAPPRLRVLNFLAFFMVMPNDWAKEWHTVSTQERSEN
jgi:hypothetical protein